MTETPTTDPAVAASAPLKRTPLYDMHVRLGARMVPFAGYEMPVQYKDGIIAEHLHTRSAAGLFGLGPGEERQDAGGGIRCHPARDLPAVVDGHQVIGLVGGEAEGCGSIGFAERHTVARGELLVGSR